MANRDGNPEELRIVILGGSGSGKSAIGNTILRKRAFMTRQSLLPTTLTCQVERGQFEGTPVSVVDTPGSIDLNTFDIFKCLTYSAPGPHVFLYVIPQERFTDVERLLTFHQCFFGKEASRFTMFLFTNGDELPDGVTAEQFIHQNPLPYGVGYHVFNNRSGDPSQVRELLVKINSMAKRNGGYYCIKVKDWKDKYLYPFASAVTIGGSIGAASGGTRRGVLGVTLWSFIGLFATIANLKGLPGAVRGSVAVNVAVFGVFAVALEVVFGAGVSTFYAFKATSAIAAGAAIFRAVASSIDDPDKFISALLGITGGPAVGAGALFATVGVHAAMSDVDQMFAGIAVLIGVISVLFSLFGVVYYAAGTKNKIFGFIFGAVVSFGAAFGAAAGILGESRFPAGVIITKACQAVAWWLNKN